MKGYLISILYVFFISHAVANENQVLKYDVVQSYDAEKIAYSVYGSGDTALVFVHGWSCDQRYWKEQLNVFAKKYKVISIDLAGHGNSSSNRLDYTINAFSMDVQAVLEREKVNDVILIGHSMGGSIVASVAKNNPTIIKGIIGVDTFHNVSSVRSQKMIDSFMKPFAGNYAKTMEVFVSRLFTPQTDAGIKRWISHDMTSAHESVAVSAIGNFMMQFKTGDSSSVFETINIPVISINATQRPTNESGNNEKIKNYQLVYIEGTGHFPMLEKPKSLISCCMKLLRVYISKTQKKIKNELISPDV